jgi:molecular chaperone Hsp33
MHLIPIQARLPTIYKSPLPPYNPCIMTPKDTLQGFIFEDRPIRGEWVHLRASLQTIIKQHAYPANISRLLGEALACATLVSGIIKTTGRMTLQFQSDGPLRLLTASCTHNHHIRGLAQFDETIDVNNTDLIKHGQLIITFQPEDGSPYQGIVEIHNGNIAQAVEQYFLQSEQLPTRLFIAVNEMGASGLLIQMLPGNEHATEDWSYATHLAQVMEADELLNLANEKLLHRLYHEDDIRLFDQDLVIFKCTCTQNRCENAIRMMDKEDIYELLQEKPYIDVCCEFCNKTYQFDRVDVQQLIKTDVKLPSSKKSH